MLRKRKRRSLDKAPSRLRNVFSSSERCEREQDTQDSGPRQATEHASPTVDETPPPTPRISAATLSDEEEEQDDDDDDNDNDNAEASFAQHIDKGKGKAICAPNDEISPDTRQDSQQTEQEKFLHFARNKLVDAKLLSRVPDILDIKPGIDLTLKTRMHRVQLRDDLKRAMADEDRRVSIVEERLSNMKHGWERDGRTDVEFSMGKGTPARARDTEDVHAYEILSLWRRWKFMNREYIERRRWFKKSWRKYPVGIKISWKSRRAMAEIRRRTEAMVLDSPERSETQEWQGEGLAEGQEKAEGEERRGDQIFPQDREGSVEREEELEEGEIWEEEHERNTREEGLEEGELPEEELKDGEIRE